MYMNVYSYKESWRFLWDIITDTDTIMDMITHMDILQIKRHYSFLFYLSQHLWLLKSLEDC